MLTQNSLAKLAFVFLIYDVSNKASFDSLESFVENFNGINTEDTRLLYIIGNKSDIKTRAVDENEAREWAVAKELKYFETSAKTGAGIDEAFRQALEQICKNLDEKKYQPLDKLERFGITNTTK